MAINLFIAQGIIEKESLDKSIVIIKRTTEAGELVKEKRKMKLITLILIFIFILYFG